MLHLTPCFFQTSRTTPVATVTHLSDESSAWEPRSPSPPPPRPSNSMPLTKPIPTTLVRNEPTEPVKKQPVKTTLSQSSHAEKLLDIEIKRLDIEERRLHLEERRTMFAEDSGAPGNIGGYQEAKVSSNRKPCEASFSKTTFQGDSIYYIT